ncbi:LOW QUALITY PROTEIN: reverse transcriptase [Phytophthora megakarya]|uniref:Reverse transcriptase n=1 Tax=Phytophthora megakarya TaxID=4795 RepID=A0A225V1M2_9STRA|nr:LOW QUALITY PROTEIN: reverse transcriptase [Phytophthora megakarya]
MRWNLSISVVKSFWGMPKMEYLGHKVSYNGIEANPKDLSALTDLAFPGSLRAMQSFLGSLNYYSRFIKDYAIYASVLYELREIDFVAMMREATQARIQQVLEAEDADQGSQEDQGVDHRRTLDPEAPDPMEVDSRWIHAHRPFNVLKTRVATTPILRHFDPDRKATVVVYASDWAISGSLMHEYDQIYYPVTFASRTLKSNELNYGIAEREVLALLRIMDLNYNASTALQGCLGQWAALLSPWTLEITKCVKGEDETLGSLAASINPRSEVDKALVSIAPKKEPRRTIQGPIPTIGRNEELYVVSFDGSARVKRGGGAYIPLCLDLLEDLDPQRLVICGDSNLVVRQVRGEIDCKAPGLTRLRQRVLDRLRTWPDHELLHVKRDWNESADSLASAALQRQCGIEIESDARSRISSLKVEEGIAQVSAVTTRSKARSGVRVGSDPNSLREEVVRELLIEQIRQAQDEESWIMGLKKYMIGEIQDMTQEEAKMFGSIAMNYEEDQLNLLFYCPTTKETAADRDKLMRLVIPETLQQDILHHYHTSLQGGHQGVGRTYDRIRDHFHWRGLYKSVQRYVGECVDCETGKGRPRIQGESPGNIQATYPFQIIAIDHIPSLPRSFNANTELLIFVDLFSGYVIAKVSASRSAQTIAETYEECVFRRFGASEVIRHDREPGFMSDFFKLFNKILERRQRATMAYRPQANRSAARTVQTTIRALKMYVEDLDQRDWDEYAQRLTFAINTARDRIRGETPFYMIHGWDPRSTLEAVIPGGEHSQAQSRYEKMAISNAKQAREQVNQRLREAIADRADTHNDLARPHPVESGSRVWLYLDRIGEYAVKLEVAGSTYSIFPVVHVSKIKLVKVFPDRPVARLNGSEGDRVDFDEALLLEDSWIQERDPDEYKVERISDDGERGMTESIENFWYIGVDMKIRPG